MSIGEKLYLVMAVSMFASFGILLAILSWLDSKDDRISRARARQQTKLNEQTTHNDRHRTTKQHAGALP